MAKTKEQKLVYMYYVCYRNYTHLMYPTKWSSTIFSTEAEAKQYAKERRSENKKDKKKPYPYIMRLIGHESSFDSTSKKEYVPEDVNPDDPSVREVYIKY